MICAQFSGKSIPCAARAYEKGTLLSYSSISVRSNLQVIALLLDDIVDVRCSISKMYTVNHVSVNLKSWSMAAELNYVVVIFVHMRPRAVPLAMIMLRKALQESL